MKRWKMQSDKGPVSERVAINRRFYTICHWATIDIHRTINRNPLWNGAKIYFTF